MKRFTIGGQIEGCVFTNAVAVSTPRGAEVFTSWDNFSRVYSTFDLKWVDEQQAPIETLSGLFDALGNITLDQLMTQATHFEHILKAIKKICELHLDIIRENQ